MIDEVGNYREVVGYIRVSTDDQDVTKQREIIEHHARRLNLKITRFIRVEVSSGKSMLDRKLEFLNTLKKGDVLICTETSRLSRKLTELLGIVDGLLEQQVRLIFVMQGLDIKDLSNPTTKLTLHIFSMMAEHERSVVSQRTREALRVLKERGIRLGKPRGTIQKSVLDKYRSKINEWCRLGFSYRRQAKVLNVSTTALIHYVRTRKIYCEPQLKIYAK